MWAILVNGATSSADAGPSLTSAGCARKLINFHPILAPQRWPPKCWPDVGPQSDQMFAKSSGHCFCQTSTVTSAEVGPILGKSGPSSTKPHRC